MMRCFDIIKPYSIIIIMIVCFSSLGFAQVPEIVSTYPAQNELNIPRNSDLLVTFNIDMDAFTINDSTFVVNANQTGLHRGIYSYNTQTKRIIFNPENDFMLGEIVTVVLTSEILSVDDNPLENSFIWSFNIEGKCGTGMFDLDTVEYEVGTIPLDVKAVDVNNDGHLDIMTVSENADILSVLINNGDATFMPKIDYLTGANPTSIAPGDFNSDNYIDLAITNNHSYNISVFINKGNGAYYPQILYPVNGNTIDLIAADLNGNGYLDLASANNNSGTISILLNNEDGTYGVRNDYNVGVLWDIEFGDIDNDGDIDLATTHHTANTISISFNDGNGTFSTPVVYSVGDYPQYLTLADLNGDSYLDLVSSNFYNFNMTILLNYGDGSFVTNFTYPMLTKPGEVNSADLDSDGDVDIIIVRNPDTISILYNNGHGSFLNQTDIPVNNIITGLCVANLNNGGDVDIILSYRDSIKILYNQCEYLCGDANSDQTVNVSDAVYIINYVFVGGDAPDPIEAADANCDATVNVSDAVYLINYVFVGGNPPCDPNGDEIPDC